MFSELKFVKISQNQDVKQGNKDHCDVFRKENRVKKTKKTRNYTKNHPFIPFRPQNGDDRGNKEGNCKNIVNSLIILDGKTRQK